MFCRFQEGPTRAQIDAKMPVCFQSDYPTTRVIVDAYIEQLFSPEA